MRKLFAAIFGSRKNTETIVDGAVSGLDKMFFTDEEKSDASGKMAEWYLRYLAATQPQNLARRFIAIVVVMLWAFLILVGIASYWVDETFALFVFDVLRDIVMQPFSIVLGFYFATHMVRAWVGDKSK